MGQQFYVIRNNPQPGTPAFVAYEKRQAIKAEKKKLSAGAPSDILGEVPETPKPQRNQPSRKPRRKRN